MQSSTRGQECRTLREEKAIGSTPQFDLPKNLPLSTLLDTPMGILTRRISTKQAQEMRKQMRESGFKVRLETKQGTFIMLLNPLGEDGKAMPSIVGEVGKNYTGGPDVEKYYSDEKRRQMTSETPRILALWEQENIDDRFRSLYEPRREINSHKER